MKWFRPSTGVELPVPLSYRYGLFPFFVIAVFFIVLAPVYWNAVQLRSGTVAEAYENSDLYHFYYPAYQHTFGRMTSGALPLWNARQMCGTPMLADPRLGVFQPLNIVFLAFPTDVAMAVHAYLCLFLMGLFFVLFARAFGVGYFAAALGATVYVLAGFSAAAIARPPLASALAWTPFLLWAVREYAHRFDTATAVLAGIAGGLLALSGAGAMALAGIGIAVLYAFQSTFFADSPGVPFVKRVRGVGIMAGIMCGIAAIQWWPALMWARALETPSRILWGMPEVGPAPDNAVELLAQLVTSEPGAAPRIAYVGIIPLIIALVAIVPRHRRRDAICWIAVLGTCLVLAVWFGSQLPLGFPAVSLYFPVAISFAVLSAISADRLFTPRRNFRSPPVWVAVIIALLMSAVLFVAFGAEVRRYVIPFALVMLVFAVVRFRGMAPLCYGAVFILLLVDLATANRTVFTHPKQDAPGCFEPYSHALLSARDQALGGRLFVSGRDLDRGISGNAGMLIHANTIGGVDLPLTREQSQWWDRLAGQRAFPLRASGKDIGPNSAQASLLRFMAARVLVATPQGALYGGTWAQGGPRLREVTGSGDVRLFVLDDSLPRAYWVPTARVEVGMAAALDALAKPDFDAARMCVVDALSPGIANLNLPGVEQETTPAAAATCSVEDISAEKVVIRVDAPSQGVTVLADTYAPGWRATLDGKREPMLRVNGLFRGIATPVGKHVIEMRYRPTSFYAGAVVSVITLLVVAYAGIRGFRRQG